MFYFHNISFHEQQGAMCYPYSIIEVYFRFFELNIFIIVEESFDNIDFIFTDHSGFAQPVNKVDYTIGLPDFSCLLSGMHTNTYDLNRGSRTIFFRSLHCFCTLFNGQ